MKDKFRRIFERTFEMRELMGAMAALLFVAVLYIDHQSGTELGSSLLYVGPIFMASIYFGSTAGCVLALLSGATWFALNALPRMGGSSHTLILIWNALMRTGFFVMSVSLARVYLHMREARKISELKSQMLSLVSHDLNNFTTVIKMAVAILEDTEENPAPNRVAAYEALSGNVDKIANTVRAFLDMARLESGRFELRPQRVMLRDFARKILEGYTFAVKMKALTLEMDMPDHALPVRADPAVLAMVMGNLLSNAIKYTPDGGRVTARLRKIDERHAEVSVEDTGVGIPVEDHKKIFSGFYRTQIGKSVAGGQGLGLKLTQEMVALHGGELKLESAVGRGSRFYFTLPIWDGPAPAQALFTPESSPV